MSSDSGMNLRLLLLLIGSVSLPLACGDPGGPDYATLSITTTSLSNAVANLPYSDTLTASGGVSSYTWSVTDGALPTGLSLTASTGIISGTPSAPVSNTFTVQVASGDGQTDTQQLAITVEAPVLEASELCADYRDYAIATFEDANLEEAIRTALLVGSQEALTCGLVSGLTELDADGLGIVSVMGVQNLTGLTSLYLYANHLISDISPLSGLTSLDTVWLGYNSISDIGPLSGLTSLRSLDLGRNSISDIGPLSGLTNLTGLYLYDNPISDISALSGLTSLTSLGFSNNSISDISPLSGLTNLDYLTLPGNTISDIGPLSGLTSLSTLYLHNNSISDISALRGLTSLTSLSLSGNANLTDIQPLLDNTGLGAGDTVTLRSTGVNCTDVAALQAKGVTVYSDCP